MHKIQWYFLFAIYNNMYCHILAIYINKYSTMYCHILAIYINIYSTMYCHILAIYINIYNEPTSQAHSYFSIEICWFCSKKFVRLFNFKRVTYNFYSGSSGLISIFFCAENFESIYFAI